VVCLLKKSSSLAYFRNELEVDDLRFRRSTGCSYFDKLLKKVKGDDCGKSVRD